MSTDSTPRAKSRHDRLVRPREVETSKRFLDLLARTKQPSRRHRAYSYHLKHVCERWAKEYISNESLIEASRQLGIPMAWAGDGSPNCYLAVSVKSVRALDPQQEAQA